MLTCSMQVTIPGVACEWTYEYRKVFPALGLCDR